MLIRGILVAAGTAAVVVGERALAAPQPHGVAHALGAAHPDAKTRIIVGALFALPFVALVLWATIRESAAKAKAAASSRQRPAYFGAAQNRRR